MAILNGRNGVGDILRGDYYWHPNPALHGIEEGDILYGYDYQNYTTAEGGANDHDRLYGYALVDYLYGGGGNDWLYGGSGNDWLYGGAQNDSLYGEAGDDYLDGGSGNDTLNGGPAAGRDVMRGGDGDDWFVVSDLMMGQDVADGGLGIDVLSAEAGIYGLTAPPPIGGAFPEYITGVERFYFATFGGEYRIQPGFFDQFDYFYYSDTKYIIHNYSGKSDFRFKAGTATNEILVWGADEAGSGDIIWGHETWRNALGGRAGNDSLRGGANRDKLVGDSDISFAFPGSGPDGNDTLEGLGGDDELIPGGGVDSVLGGTGNDLVILDELLAGEFIDGGADTDTLRLRADVTGAVTSNWVVPAGATLAGFENVVLTTGRHLVSAGFLDDFATLSLLVSFGSTVPVTILHANGGTTDLSGTGIGTGGSFVPNPRVNFGGADDPVNGDVFRAPSWFGDMRMEGRGGDDWLVAGSGSADTLFGGAGNDTLDSGGTSFGGDPQATRLYGEAGNDSLIGTGGLYGGEGDDTLVGFGEGTFLVGGAGADLMRGGYGSQTFSVNEVGDRATDGSADPGEVDRLIATVDYVVDWNGTNEFIEQIEARGNIRITGGANAEWIYGDGGDQTIAGGGALFGTGVNRIYAGGGDDTVIFADAYAAADIAYGGAGTDTADFGGAGDAVRIDMALGTASGGNLGAVAFCGFERAVGTGFGDRFYGTEGADTFVLSGGADIVYGRGGLDLVDYAGEGAGVYVHLANRVSYFGGLADDYLYDIEGALLTAFDDRFYGTDGDDWSAPGLGQDTLYGLLGDDTVSYADAPGAVRVELNHRYALDGGGFTDFLYGLEHVVGSGFGDRLYGSGGANSLSGGSGRDILYGLADGDSLLGGDGDDRLVGGGGVDQLAGGRGADRFYFTGTELGGADAILDFEDEDLLYVANSGFLGVQPGTNPSFAQGLGEADDIAQASGAGAGTFLHDLLTGRLWFDATGAGTAGDAVLVATVTTATGNPANLQFYHLVGYDPLA